MSIDENAFAYAMRISGLYKTLNTRNDVEIIHKLFESYESAKSHDDKAVERVALAIHQCHYHPVDWGTKEHLGMFEREKPLAIAMAKAAIAALNTRSPIKSEGWQPIETAPKEQAISFLVYRPKYGEKYTWASIIQVSIFEGRMYPDARDACIDWDDGIDNATHWMPLPAPPALNTQPEGDRR